MILVFSASTDLFSSQRTSRFIGPILRWLVPDLSDVAVYRVQYAVRKTGHVTEYAVLAVLLWRALRQPRRDDDRPWTGCDARRALALAAAYALTDEAHQALTASRMGSGWDVLLDITGAGLGLMLVWGWGRWRGRW